MAGVLGAELRAPSSERPVRDSLIRRYPVPDAEVRLSPEPASSVPMVERGAGSRLRCDVEGMGMVAWFRGGEEDGRGCG